MLAFGCSIVAGEELEGKQTIPKLFAEHIGEPLINHGLIGAGNDEILLEAFEKIEPGHTILVGITDVARVFWPHIAVTDGLQTYSVNEKSELNRLKETLDLWFKWCYNELTLEQYYIKRFKHLEKYCEMLGNKIYFFSGITPPTSQFQELHGANWHTSSALIDYADQYGRELKGHPNEICHIKYFESMKEELNL
jgi:hypothetical protein